MTREEANVLLKMMFAFWANTHERTNVEMEMALNLALSALRPASRERVEKAWRGEWMGSGDGYADGELVYDTWECSHCGHVIDEEDDPDMLPQFCPKCYAAMTDEAVQMVMERLEALNDADTNS